MIFLEGEFKYIQVYADVCDNLILVPTGFNKEGLLMGIDMVIRLDSPYTDEQLETAIFEAMNNCFLKEADAASGLERHLGVKGYAKAVKDRRLVIIRREKGVGYIINSSIKNRENYVFNEEINLGEVLEEGIVAKAFRQALAMSRK